ncbi:MAG: hypothetical protein GX066_04170 [Clostridiaceae bacterium]|nr:hypothetical protein [Clostridiaceae bacterium]
MGIVLDVLTIVLFVMVVRKMIGFVLRLLKPPMAETSVHNTRTYEYREEKDTKDVKGVEYQTIEMVKDPVCGKYIQKDKAYQVVTNENQVVHFCSWDCREKYIKGN